MGVKITLSILAFFAVFALWGIVLSSRFSMSATSSDFGVYQQDNWTGQITLYQKRPGGKDLEAVGRTAN